MSVRLLPVLVSAVLVGGLVMLPTDATAAPLPCVGGSFWKTMGTSDPHDDESWYRHCTNDGSRVVVTADLRGAIALTVEKCVAPNEEWYIAKRSSIRREPSYAGRRC